MMSGTCKSLIGAAVFVLLIAGGSRAQDKTIRWSAVPQGSDGVTAGPPLQFFKQLDSIEIEEVTVEGASVIIGQPFSASSDWLNHITFRVRNNSGKRLTFVQVTLTLPQLKGHIQIPYAVPDCAKEKKTCMQPGEAVELRMLGQPLYEWVKKSVAEQKLDLGSIDRAEVLFVMATLEDGTQWSSGCVKTADVWHPCPHS